MKRFPTSNSLNACLCSIVALLLLSCSSGSVGPIHYYLIDPVKQPTLRENTNPLALEIMDLQIPQYLERFQIASRGEGNRLVFSDTYQWGENFRKNLTRTFARNISHLLGTIDIGTPDNRSSATPDFRIKVFIEAFERHDDGMVRLIARWQIVSGQGEHLFSQRANLSSSHPVTVGDYDGIVDIMQSLFGRLSQKVAESVVTLENNSGNPV